MRDDEIAINQLFHLIIITNGGVESFKILIELEKLYERESRFYTQRSKLSLEI